jgi:dihydroorotase
MAQLFENENALDKLGAFCSRNGPAYYGLPVNEDKMTLQKQSQPVSLPAKVKQGDIELSVFDPAQAIYWQVV